MNACRAGTIVVVCTAAVVSAACEREAPPNPAIDSAFVHAESTYKRGAIDSTEAELNALLTSAESRGDSVSIGRALAALAVVANRKGEYDELQRLAERALSMPLRPADRFRAHNNLGLGAFQQS